MSEAFYPTTMGLYTTPCTDSAVAHCRVGRFRVHGGSPHESLAVHSRQQALFAHGSQGEHDGNCEKTGHQKGRPCEESGNRKTGSNEEGGCTSGQEGRRTGKKSRGRQESSAGWQDCAGKEGRRTGQESRSGQESRAGEEGRRAGKEGRSREKG